MYLGHMMEITESGTLYREPLHPYTKALLSSIPIPDPELEDKRERILLKGEPAEPGQSAKRLRVSYPLSGGDA